MTETAWPIVDERERYDVIVVGSGAGGGMATYALAEAGARVLVLETGRDYDPYEETPMLDSFEAAPLHNSPTPDKQQGFYDATVNGGWEVPGEPYTVADGSRFKWWRARMLGGRTNHWGRLSLRFGPYDFEGYTRDGIGADWPLSYNDVAPYYDRVERLIGVFGAAEGIENSPDSPADVLQPPPKMRAYERWLQMSLKKSSDVDVVPAHMAILTKPLPGRAACFYASDCQRGCNIGANFQSTTVFLPPAVATGNVTIQTNAHVYKVAMGRDGKAEGVMYVDRKTGRRRRVRGRAVMLAASTCETARILLTTKTATHRDGLGNNSGHVGRHLTDTVNVGLSAQVPSLEDIAPYNDEGVSLYHAYAPYWDYDGIRSGRRSFSKGYHLEFWGGRFHPFVSDIRELASMSGQRGSNLRRDVRRLFGSVVYISGRGEMIPNDGTYCELDPDVRDQFGLPVLRFHWRHDDHDLATATDIRNSVQSFFDGMNAKILSDTSAPIEDTVRAGGTVVHEAGSCRMGASSDTSVCDSSSRLWDCENVYLADASVFASNPDKNPTLTIMALAWRATDHLLDRMRKREL